MQFKEIIIREGVEVKRIGQILEFTSKIGT